MNDKNKDAVSGVADAGELRRRKKRAAQLTRIIIIAVIGILLCVVYFVAAPMLDKEEEAPVGDAQTESVAVARFSSSEVTDITYTYGENAPISLLCSGSVWSYADDADFPVIQTAAAAMAEAISNITASRELTEPEDLSQYGFSAPTLTVTVTYKDRGSYTYEIGSYNSYSSVYYLRSSTSASVFTVSGSIVTAFGKTLDDLLQLEALPGGVDFVSYSVRDVHGESAKYDDEALLGLLSDLKLLRSVGFKPTEEEAQEYGLADGLYTELTVNYTEDRAVEGENISDTSITVSGSYSLRVGGTVPDDGTERYVLYGDSPIVYTADSSVLDALISGVGEMS